MDTLDQIISGQRSFFRSQKTKDIGYRLSLLKGLKSELINNEQNIFDALKKDFRKSEFETFISEIALVHSELNLAIKNLKKWSKPKRIRSSLLTFPSKDYIYREPYGTVLVIAPWNYPLLLSLNPFIMAIAAGNTVVLKPSELTQNTSKVLTEIIEKVFSKDLAVSFKGGKEVSQALLKKRWDYIFFTGSTQVGKIVYAAAAQHLTPVTLELGGKSPCIVDETIDLNLVARRLVWGKFLNAGQTCIAPDYVIIHESIKIDFIEALRLEITKRYGTDPKTSVDLPRIINCEHFKRLKSLIRNETIVFGGEIDEYENYISPTIIDNPSLDSNLMNEEIFGPILPILTFSSIEDIKKILYSLDKPLAFYTFSKDKKFIKLLLETFSFGGGVINDLLVQFGNARLPFGGVGKSGLGQYHGKYGFDTFTHAKPIMKRGTWLDPSFRYPPYRGKLNFLKKVFKYLG